jgi:hypothetical protein
MPRAIIDYFISLASIIFAYYAITLNEAPCRCQITPLAFRHAISPHYCRR